jgi:hypothetical protein
MRFTETMAAILNTVRRGVRVVLRNVPAKLA